VLSRDSGLLVPEGGSGADGPRKLVVCREPFHLRLDKRAPGIRLSLPIVGVSFAELKLPAITETPCAKKAYCPDSSDSCPVGVPAQLLTVPLITVNESKSLLVPSRTEFAAMFARLSGDASAVAGGL